MDLRTEVQARLRQAYPSVVALSNSPAIWQLNGYPANVRTANEKAGDKFWFDVTPDLYERRQVEFFLYCCGSADVIYVFPRVNFEHFVRTASLGGQKQVPNFTLYSDTNVFEPAGHAETRFNIAGFRNAFYLVPGGTVSAALYLPTDRPEK